MNEESAPGGLERALARVEASSDTALKATTGLGTTLKRLRGAAREGNLRDLRTALDATRNAIKMADQEVSNVLGAWELSEEAYLQTDGFADELLDHARRQGLGLVRQDGRLYCYPALIRVVPADRSVLIDKKRERRLRPSVLVGVLRNMQRRPPRFKPADFLESLYTAYGVALAEKGRLKVGTVVPLLEIYKLLTMLPGQTNEYSTQEFARDIHLLDESGHTRTKDGSTVDLPAATGTKQPKGMLSVITQHGVIKPYYGISFLGTSG